MLRDFFFSCRNNVVQVNNRIWNFWFSLTFSAKYPLPILGDMAVFELVDHQNDPYVLNLSSVHLGV